MIDAARAARSKRYGRRRTTLRNPTSSIVTVGVGNGRQRNSAGSVTSITKHSSSSTTNSNGRKLSSELEEYKCAFSDGEDRDKFVLHEEEEQSGNFAFMTGGESQPDSEDLDQESISMMVDVAPAIEGSVKQQERKRRSRSLFKPRGSTAVESGFKEPETEMIKGQRTFKMIERSNKKLMAKLLESD